MNGMMRFPKAPAVVTPALGGSPPIPSSIPQYPWVDGELLYAEALNAAIEQALVLTDTVNGVDYGMDPTGVADSCSALNAALATGKNVYVPAGKYLLRCMVTVGNQTRTQFLYGAGHATTFVVDDTFDPNAICVFLLRGAENWACRIHDIRIQFIQPTSTNGSMTRATMKTLAAGGTSTPNGTGVRYPPAIMWGDDPVLAANRFRLERIRIEAAWDGFVQGQYGSGGYIINDVEVGAVHNGLVIGNNGDHAQVRSYHQWVFGIYANSDMGNVYNDGNAVAIQLGNAQTGNQAAGITFSNIQIYNARINIDAYGGGGLHFSNLQMDTTNASIRVTVADHVFISNLYFSNNEGMTQPCLWVTSGAGGVYGRVTISNLFGWNTNYPMVQVDAGTLTIKGGFISAAGGVNRPIVVQNNGWLEISDVMFSPQINAPWTVSPVQHVAGVLLFHDNTFTTQPAPSESGAPCISLADDYRSVVKDNSFNGWPFMPPGPRGLYGPNNQGNPNAATNVGPRMQGVNAQLASYFGTTPPYGVVNLMNVDSVGNVHMGGNGNDVIVDSNDTFLIGGAFVDNSGQGASNPASGSSLQIPNNCGLYSIETGGLAALTVTLPANPKVNQQLRIWSSGTITSFTLLPSPGQTLPATVTTLTANRSLLFIWASGPWFMLTGG